MEQRQGPDRRIAQRRVKNVPVKFDRRSGRDRRWAIRRDSDIETAIKRMVALVRAAKTGKNRRKKTSSSRKAKRPRPKTRASARKTFRKNR